jgi:hypothetical protein
MLVWLVFGSKESKKTPAFPLCSGFPERSGTARYCGGFAIWCVVDLGLVGFRFERIKKKLQPFRFAVVFQSDLVLRDIVVALPSGVLWMLVWLVFGSKES